MNIKITMWLQDEIYKHAQVMACEKVAEEFNEVLDQLSASNISSGWGIESDNPSYGEFSFNVSIWSNGEMKTTHLRTINLTIREVMKDYLSREDS